MSHTLGDPINKPCAQIKRSRSFLDTIEREAGRNVELKLANKKDVETGIVKLRGQVKDRIDDVCSAQCATIGRCMLDSFGSSDPLLSKKDLTPLEQKELGAKRELDIISFLAEHAIGIALM